MLTDRGVDVGALVLARLDDAFRLARAILLDDGDAEDAIQEASLAAWRRRSSLRDPERFEPWFERIVVNQCRDQLRRRNRAVPLAPRTVDLDVAGGGAGSAVERGEDPDIDRALAALDLDHRLVVVMRYWQDRSVEDIASRLGIPAGTVKSRLHHALKRIRGSLEASRAEEARRG